MPVPADTIDAAGLLERGRLARAQGRAADAIEDLRAALAIEPALAEAHHQLGNALKGLHRYAEAAASLRAAALLAPQSGAVWLNLGVACLELRRLDEAVACFRRAVRLEPTRPEAHNILGHALLTKGRCTPARQSLEEALRLRPGYAAAHDNLGRVLKTQGLAAEALPHHRAALAAAPKAETHSNLLFSLNFPADLPPEEIAAEHRRWAELYAAPLRKPADPAVREPSASRRLRVGYVSPDFVNHAVAYFIEPVLAAHDRDRFEITCYSDARVPDAVTRRLQGRADRWREIAAHDHDEVAALVRADGIDILVDLAGHTARHRLLAFARRPAPVQVTWLGYPNTTGLAAIDYRLTDAVSDPPGSEAWHSEELLRLPGPFSCYQPSVDSPAVGPLPAAATGAFTFGCFNHLAKITPAVLDLWAEILRDQPAARLLLRSRGLVDRETTARVRADFAARGVAPSRLECDGEELSLTRHLGRYGCVDVALDPFPYNGTTTTCEALWMGAPVVTLAGRTHVSRVGASLLTHVGASGWIADSAAAYVAICRELTADPGRLAALRAGLRDRMRASPLCDGPGFTRRLEEAFRAMWVQRINR
jgi:predicted O-linked N-acetylglucosamine transferase (SPINDLY family)